MNEFRQHWTELRPLYRALLVVFAIAALAAVGEAVHTIVALIEIMG